MNDINAQRFIDNQIFHQHQQFYPPSPLPPRQFYPYPYPIFPQSSQQPLHMIYQPPQQIPQQIPQPMQPPTLEQPWTQPPLPEYLDPKKSIDLKLIRKAQKKDSRCYTCKPRGKVKKHMINTSSSGLFSFHHDLHKRPILIVTPNRHIESVNDMTSEEKIDIFKSIEDFMKFWNIDDYQVSFNSGRWQNHEHLHFKIRISEKIINRMRRDHFSLVKMETVFSPDEE